MFSSNQMIILLRNTTPWYSMVLYKRKINLLVLYNLGQVGVSVFFEFSKCSSEVQPIKSYQNSNYSKLLEKVQLELLNDSNKLQVNFYLQTKKFSLKIETKSNFSWEFAWAF